MGSPKMSLQWSLNPEISGAFITGGNAKSGHPVVMRFLIAGIVIMKRRTHWTLIPFVGTTFRDMKLKWSYAPNVALSKMSNKIALAVEFAWGSTFARNANSSMMITGGKENFFHCNKCGCCYSNVIQDSHHCVERAMHHNCPVCFEFLFDTMKEVTVLPCGHTIHLECVKEMELHFRYSCPVCSKSICDMSDVWEKLDREIASTPMPQLYQNKLVRILCNDCGETSVVHFHVVAHKCQKCKSYNTRQIQGGSTSSCPSRIGEVTAD
ncbi:hypothetical protein RHGRI_002255 [Rhododendron griersonianum]|uniref:Uncharacterized protein n=1 Tax=Rhododendron griersonianum TaxID=479676 RepID=A0AAV6LN69_9ERIC|nr:hypothetical protein RHGRI_002255 [Rhododendron griersonianum]KAG5566634.1 hypothetical protein RHGRI_002255 [Rhododendron griersonianum]